MEIKPIKTEADYDTALRKIEGLMSAAADSPEGDRLDVLASLVEADETEHYPIDPPNRSRQSSSAWSRKALRARISSRSLTTGSV